MNNQFPLKTSALLQKIFEFLSSSQGLRYVMSDSGIMTIRQLADKKNFKFNVFDLSDVLSREDAQQKSFLQINFSSGVKVILTENLIGFKPSEVSGVDLTKIPKVVTTPDLRSVYEALEDLIAADNTNPGEALVLRKVFISILEGGEKAGFNLEDDRNLLSRFLASHSAASA